MPKAKHQIPSPARRAGPTVAWIADAIGGLVKEQFTKNQSPKTKYRVPRRVAVK
ncbi:MAG: hypothetical protein SFX18_13570 [Pirellulales bacterium]|nr:hypothetical protein [Pirellulales bacterium]